MPMRQLALRPVRRQARARWWALTVLLIVASGCTTVRITATERSSIEQRLLVRSLERAAAHVNITPLVGRRVRLELFTLTKDQAFAREFLRTRLESRGLRVVSEGDGDLTLRVFAAALAVDTANTLLGLPAMQAPMLSVPIPEIALFKWERSRGHAEIQSYVYDATGEPLGQVPDALGEAKYDRFTVLIFISFAVTDIDKPPARP